MVTVPELEGDALEASLRALRPRGPEPSSLEQRLAVASILAASGLDGASPRLGRLEVQTRIGGGGMGVVYRAFDPELERFVAVKLLRGLGDVEERALIVREARSLARLSHPNVVAVHDIVEDEGELCIVMEYVAGVTLRGWLDAHPEAPWREVLEWFVQAARGVSAAHEAGVVHQDLKPENILIGDDGRARVVDFGLARLGLGDDEGLAGGTPRYMAPEISKERPATPSSDQYSFCVALREALEGRGASAVTHAAIARGMQRDAQERYETIAALLAVLEPELGSPGVDRPRRLLLERVDRLWVRGVLERSLEGGAVAALHLRGAPELVESPWQRWGAADDDDGAKSSHDLKQLLRESNGSLLLVGPPGSGKTTLLLSLCRELLRTATLLRGEPAPAVLSLSTYTPETRASRSLSAHFASWVVDELVAKYGLPRPAVRRWFSSSELVLLLDGLDETDPRTRGRVVETLSRFREDHAISMVVTCRDDEYEAHGQRLSFGSAARVQPLDDASVIDLVEGRRAPELLARLQHDDELRDQLRNPLLLTLLAGGAAPHDRSDASIWQRAWKRYVERALDAASSDVERATLTGQLRFLARAMRAHNTSDLWLERLHFGWLVHRWETAAAYATGVVLVLLFGVGLNLTQVPLTGNTLVSALVFGVGVSLSSFAYTRGRIKPVESLRWSWRRMMRLLPITTLCATLVGLAEGLRVNFAANLVGAALTGAILGVTFALDVGERAGKVTLNAGVHRSALLALSTSLCLGVPAGLLFGLVLDPYVRAPLIDVVEGGDSTSLMAGVSVGLFVSTALFLIYGGFAVLMHYVLRLWLAWRTPLPLDLERMFDRAVELGLMRRVGGGHVFLHRTLLEHFADSS